MTKVLIVDDDLPLLEALKTAVEMNQHIAHAVSDAGTVYEVIKKYTPDIILLDILLSGYDGIEIAKTLKAEPETRDIPLIMLSASTNMENVVKEVGADGYLSKPFEIEELWAVIGRHSAS